MVFIINMKPMAKPRSRSVYMPKLKRVVTYNPPWMKKYVNDMKTLIKNQMQKKGWVPFLDGDIPLHVTMQFEMVKTKTKEDKVRKGPTKKPDIDNLQKMVLDCLTGEVFFDDDQIVAVTAIKRWAKQERITVSVDEFSIGE